MILTMTKETKSYYAFEIVFSKTIVAERSQTVTVRRMVPLYFNWENNVMKSCSTAAMAASIPERGPFSMFDSKHTILTAVCGYLGGMPDPVSGQCLSFEIPINQILLCPIGALLPNGQCSKPLVSLENYVKERADAIFIEKGLIAPGATPSPLVSGAP
jgi:hypothetical protein